LKELLIQKDNIIAEKKRLEDEEAHLLSLQENISIEASNLETLQSNSKSPNDLANLRVGIYSFRNIIVYKHQTI